MGSFMGYRHPECREWFREWVRHGCALLRFNRSRNLSSMVSTMGYPFPERSFSRTAGKMSAMVSLRFVNGFVNVLVSCSSMGLPVSHPAKRPNFGLKMSSMVFRQWAAGPTHSPFKKKSAVALPAADLPCPLTKPYHGQWFLFNSPLTKLGSQTIDDVNGLGQ